MRICGNFNNEGIMKEDFITMVRRKVCPRKVVLALFILAFAWTGVCFWDWTHRISISKSRISGFLEHKDLRVLFVYPKNCMGEGQFVRMASQALEKSGYYPICVYDNILFGFIFTSIFDIDICVSYASKCRRPPNAYNMFIYDIVSIGAKRIKNYEGLLAYDAVLSIVPVGDLINKIGTTIPVHQIYLSPCATEFDDRPKTHLFFCGAGWDEYRTYALLDLYKKLDETDYFNVYGSDKWKKLKVKSYRGLIPFGAENVIEVMKENGISLVLHSDGHFENDTTSSRIFEAAAASTVIISDRMPFVVSNFGDSVLYVDRSAPSDVLFKQIDDHVKWILAHPKEAVELARRAHKIFVEKFALEIIMKRVIDSYKQSEHYKLRHPDKN